MMFHNTTRHVTHLGSILNEQLLRLENDGKPDLPTLPCPALWFSVNPIMERTAIKPFIKADGSAVRWLSVDDYLPWAARIVVNDDVAPYSWTQFKRRALVVYRLANRQRVLAREVFRALELSGHMMKANPAEWLLLSLLFLRLTPRTPRL